MFTGHAFAFFTPAASGQVPAIENHAWFYVLSDSLEFKLQTCSSAEIILAVTPFNPNTDGYRVSLGMLSTITRLHYTDRTAAADTMSLFNCYTLRSYWITWVGGYVKVGHGKMGANLIVQLQDSDQLMIGALSLFTPQSQGGGEWQVSRSRGKIYIVVCRPSSFLSLLHFKYLLRLSVSILGKAVFAVFMCMEAGKHLVSN